MKILTDLHCHSLASSHAYSTITEMTAYAKQIGMQAIALTDHGVGIPDAPHMWHFINLKELPKEINGVRVLKGCEANILNIAGELDMPEEELAKLEIVVASIHRPSYKDLGAEDNTECYLNVLENPYVDIIGHSGNPKAKYDIPTVVKRAGELHKLMEINAHTFDVRQVNIPLCTEIALECKKQNVGICLNSDAHFSYSIGNYGKALKMLEEIDFPEELIINRDFNTVCEYLRPRKNLS